MTGELLGLLNLPPDHLRAIQPLIDVLHPGRWDDPQVAADLSDRDAGLRFLDADELPIPCEVKIGDEWFTLLCRIGDRESGLVLEVLGEGCAAPSYYPVNQGEPFMWREAR